jgi:hypothetical protein
MKKKLSVLEFLKSETIIAYNNCGINDIKLSKNVFHILIKILRLLRKKVIHINISDPLLVQKLMEE